MQPRSKLTLRRRRDESGAALVEFAVLAPLLILLVLGIVEFGWLFGKFTEVRHAAREGARYAAVSNPDRNNDGVINGTDVVTAVCDALNLAPNTFDLQVILLDNTGAPLPNGSVGAVGARGRLTITASVPSLTNAPIISSFLPSELTNTAEFRVEQPTAWTTPLSAASLSC